MYSIFLYLLDKTELATVKLTMDSSEEKLNKTIIR